VVPSEIRFRQEKAPVIPIELDDLKLEMTPEPPDLKPTIIERYVSQKEGGSILKDWDEVDEDVSLLDLKPPKTTLVETQKIIGPKTAFPSILEKLPKLNKRVLFAWECVGPGLNLLSVGLCEECYEFIQAVFKIGTGKLKDEAANWRSWYGHRLAYVFTRIVTTYIHLKLQQRDKGPSEKSISEYFRKSVPLLDIGQALHCCNTHGLSVAVYARLHDLNQRNQGILPSGNTSLDIAMSKGDYHQVFSVLAHQQTPLPAFKWLEPLCKGDAYLGVNLAIQMYPVIPPRLILEILGPMDTREARSAQIGYLRNLMAEHEEERQKPELVHHLISLHLRNPEEDPFDGTRESTPRFAVVPRAHSSQVFGSLNEVMTLLQDDSYAKNLRSLVEMFLKLGCWGGLWWTWRRLAELEPALSPNQLDLFEGCIELAVLLDEPEHIIPLLKQKQRKDLWVILIKLLQEAENQQRLDLRLGLRQMARSLGAEETMSVVREWQLFKLIDRSLLGEIITTKKWAQEKEEVRHQIATILGERLCKAQRRASSMINPTKEVLGALMQHRGLDGITVGDEELRMKVITPEVDDEEIDYRCTKCKVKLPKFEDLGMSIDQGLIPDAEQYIFSAGRSRYRNPYFTFESFPIHKNCVWWQF